jgi:hypothetical protein
LGENDKGYYVISFHCNWLFKKDLIKKKISMANGGSELRDYKAFAMIFISDLGLLAYQMKIASLSVARKAKNFSISRHEVRSFIHWIVMNI